MPGLLRQLQKVKTKTDSAVSEVLISSQGFDAFDNIKPAHSELGQLIGEVDKNVSEAARLLEDLIAESELPTTGLPKGRGKAGDIGWEETTSQQPKSSPKIFRRTPTRPTLSRLNKHEEAIPWWLSGGRNTTPQVEALVPLARKMLTEVLPNDTEFKVNLSDVVRQAVELAAKAIAGEIRVSRRDIEQAEKELLGVLAGKGPLEQLYQDPLVTDIFIDNHKSIKVMRRGQALESPFSFRSPEEYRLFVTAMLQSIDRVVNLSSPIVDCVLNDQWRSRINAIDASLVDGDEPRVCVRIPRLQQISFYDILQTKTLPATLAAWLAEVVASGKTNILVVGPTGSGKTVMTIALLSNVDSNERIITIEDVPEIFVPTAHLEKLVARPPNAQGEGEVLMVELLRAALRRSPHRIVVGEIRDEESRLFLRALETGHSGSIATIHADTGVDGLWRLLDLVAAYENSPQESIMRRIARCVHLVISMQRVDGQPCLKEVSEVRAPSASEFIVLPLVRFEGIVSGKRQWRILAHHSHWIDFIEKKGISLRPGPGLSPVMLPEEGKER